MKCKYCEKEFDGNFCPECGARAELENPVIYSQSQQPNYQQSDLADSKKTKKKKPIYKRKWFVLLIIIVIIFAVGSIKKSGKKIVWNEIVLENVLPQPPVGRGNLYTNTSDALRVEYKKISDKQYADYIEECKTQGFTVDIESDSSSFDAFNSEGYKLHLYHYSGDSDMSIDLEKPMEMKKIDWPVGIAGKLLPVPKSLNGSFEYENDDDFYVYIGDTSKQEYDEYVNACIKKGFNVDYSKDEKYYRAKNNSGWDLDLEYMGNNVMSIDIDKPKSEEDEELTTSSAPKTTNPPENTTKKNKKKTSKSLRPEFKKAMDSYEEFMNEHIEFMEKYEENPSNSDFFEDYGEHMKKYVKVCEDFEKWDNDDLNYEELAYYIDVQSRVNKKLLEVAE